MSSERRRCCCSCGLAARLDERSGAGPAGAGDIVRGTALEVPPPGGLTETVICAVPALAISPKGTKAKIVLRSEEKLCSGVPFQRTVPPLNPVPVTRSEKLRPPAVTVDGEMELIAGTGLRKVKGNCADVPPPGGGLMTETCAGPKKKNGGTSSEASTGAVSCVELTNAVGRSTPEKLRREPSMKFDPFTVSVKPGPPMTALEGETELTTGKGFGDGGDDGIVHSMDVPLQTAASRKLKVCAAVRDSCKPTVAAAPLSCAVQLPPKTVSA